MTCELKSWLILLISFPLAVTSKLHMRLQSYLLSGHVFLQRVFSASLLSVTLAKQNLQSVSYQTMRCPELKLPNKWLQQMSHNFLWKQKYNK